MKYFLLLWNKAELSEFWDVQATETQNGARYESV
jgi:hypothetical protein